MNSQPFESTYALLMRSEAKERSASETIIYSILIAAMVFTAWQVAHTPVRIPQSLTAPAVAQVNAIAGTNT